MDEWRKKLTLRGLQIKVKCNALLADLTDVGHKFKDTTVRAESEYLQALLDHYEKTTAKLEEDRREIEEAMRRVCEGARNREAVDCHKELLKTKNIEQKEKALEEEVRPDDEATPTTTEDKKTNFREGYEKIQ